MRRALLAVLLLGAAACSRRAELNYKHCLRVRVGMTSEELFAVMGKPEKTVPYVEGESLPHLKGRTAYEWSNPLTMPEGDHISVDDKTGKVQNVRCSDVDIVAEVYREPPARSTAAVEDSSAIVVVLPPAPAAKAPALTLADALAAYKAQDMRRTLIIALPLASAGDPQAQLLSGLGYSEDAPDPLRNPDEAQRWFYMSGRQKDCEAAALYTAAIRDRLSAEKVTDETAYAASLGCPAGKLLQADLLIADAGGGAAGREAGEKLVFSAADDGSPRAQVRAAKILAAKSPPDLVQAYRWLLLAARHPLVTKYEDPLHAASGLWSAKERAEAEDRLAELGKMLTREQRAEASRRAGPAKP